MKKIALIIAFLLCASVITAQSMEWLCRPGMYSDIQYMGNNLFKVKSFEGKWGVIHADGRAMIEAKYDSITPLVENRALLLDAAGSRIHGIVNQQGKIVKTFENEEYYVTRYPHYKEGRLCYKDKNGWCGYLNEQGNITIEAKYYLAAPFQNGIAAVQYADTNYGLITKYGGSAIVSDTKYIFLSSVVDGKLFAVTAGRIGDVLKVMQLEGNKLKSGKKFESGMYVELSDDYTYLVSQNGHQYYIDDQWRVSKANHQIKLPYTIEDHAEIITESTELLSKLVTQNGVQITYMGKPILEHSFREVATFEKRYAIVGSKNGKIGVLKLNPSAGIEFTAPSSAIVFYHNTRSAEVAAEQQEYVEILVDLKDVNPQQLKCYINEQGYLRYAPLKQTEGTWKLLLPYFLPDTEYDNILSKQVDIAITYDGLDWMHRILTLKSKHEKGYKISAEGAEITDKNGNALINIVVESVKGISTANTKVSVSGWETFFFKGKNKFSIPVKVNLPRGKTQTFTYTVTVSEEGCPPITEQIFKRITHPDPESGKEEEDIILH